MKPIEEWWMVNLSFRKLYGELICKSSFLMLEDINQGIECCLYHRNIYIYIIREIKYWNYIFRKYQHISYGYFPHKQIMSCVWCKLLQSSHEQLMGIICPSKLPVKGTWEWSVLTHWPLRDVEVIFASIFFKIILQIDILSTLKMWNWSKVTKSRHWLR